MPSVLQSPSPVFLLAAATTGGTINVTFPNPTGSGNSLVACVSSTDNGAVNPHVTGITLGGAAGNWQGVVTLNSTSRTCSEIWYDPGCTSGQTAVAVTWGGGSGAGASAYMWVSVYEVTGVLVADQISSNENTGTTWTSNATPAATNASEIFFGCVNTGSGASAPVITVTGAGTWTSQQLQSTGGPTFGTQDDGYQAVSSGGTATFSGTTPGSAFWTATVATFFPSAATSSAYATSAADRGDGSGSWANPSNATGVPDTTYAVWTAL